MSVEESLENLDSNEAEDLDTPESEDASQGEDLENTSTEEDKEQNIEDESDEDVVISIGDQEEEQAEQSQAAPPWLKKLRESQRKAIQENRELKARLQQIERPSEQMSLPPKPKLEDFDYESEKYESALDQWYSKKRAVDEQKAQMQAQEVQAQQAWQQRLDNYSSERDKLKVRDFEEAEAVAENVFSDTQRGIIVHAAENSARLIYALGKNPEIAQKLADEKDPVKFAFAASKIEKDINVRSRRKAPPPEKMPSNTGTVRGTLDSTLDKLRAEAERTGNYTKVTEYKRKLKARK